MIVWTNGCFDILHTGHLDLLEHAKNLGIVDNYLIVGIDSDRRVKELKGENRPINNENDRKRMLESLRFVDKVIIFDSDTDLRNQILAYGVDYMVVGSEYEDKEVIGVENSKNGCVFYPIDERSSTNIINKIKTETQIEIFDEIYNESHDKDDYISINFNNYAVGKLRKLKQ